MSLPAEVAFRLNNHTSVYSEFEAFFDAESAYEFTVQPTSGVEYSSAHHFLMTAASISLHFLTFDLISLHQLFNLI